MGVIRSKLASFWRRLSQVPFGLSALAVLLLIFLVDIWAWQSAWSMLLLAAVFVGILLWFRPARWWLIMVCGFVSAFGYYDQLSTQRDLESQVGKLVRDDLLIVSEVSIFEDGDAGRAVGKFISGEKSGSRASLSLKGEEVLHLRRGDLVQVYGNLLSLPEPRNPGVFDQREWLWRDGIAVKMLVYEWDVIGAAWWRPAGVWLERLRDRVEASVTMGLPESRAVLIRAMFLGEKPSEDPELMEVFRNSGVLHVFAVSGLHVMMVGALVYGLVRWLPIGLWAKAVLVVLAMALYAGITGWNAPAERAVIMGAVIIFGWPLRRKPMLLNSVAFCAVLICAMDGHELFKPGFQLSYGVILSLVLLTAWWNDRFSVLQCEEDYLPRQLYTKKQQFFSGMVSKGLCGLAVGTSAWCGSVALIWVHFGVFSPVALVVGFPMVLMVWCVLVLSCVSLVVGVFSDMAAGGVVSLNGFVASRMEMVASWSSRVPGGYVVSQPWSKGERVVVYDVGLDGSAVYIGLAGGVLLDCGNERFASGVLAPSLQNMGARVDSLVLTHGDAQHAGGGMAILDAFPMKQCVLHDAEAVSPAYRTVWQSASEEGLLLSRVSHDIHWSLGNGNSLEVLSSALDGRTADDRMLVTRLNWKNKRVIFAGDLGFGGFEQMVSRVGDLSADVLVLGSHSSDPLDIEAVVDAVQPQTVILGRSRRYYPEEELEQWRQSLESRGAKLILQENTGAVTLLHQNGEIVCEATMGK